ncbi:hypothetical protein BJY00DRAFT_312143 [Aspergillus carlsbadensis]|nr:hypothetical protein BJY00DRAFT_312143 [Aspergillus carlsbadensis]
MGGDRSLTHSRKRRRTDSESETESESESEPEPSDYLHSVLEDCHLALTPTNADDADRTIPPQPRVDTILHLALAQVKKNLQKEYSLDTLKTVFWSYEQVISLHDPDDDGDEILDCTLDYVLWYGKEPHLETNCIVICAEEPISGAEEYAPIVAAVDVIHHNRAQRGVKKETFGIFTDGFTWVFRHLDEENMASPTVVKRMDGIEQAIIDTVSAVLEKAATTRLLYRQPLGDWETRPSMWDWDQHAVFYWEGGVTFTRATDTSRVASFFRSMKTAWLKKVYSKRQKNSKESKEAEDTYGLAQTSDEGTDRTSDRSTRSVFIKESTDQAAEKPAGKPEEKNLPSMAVTELTDYEVEDIFDLSYEENPGDVWHLNASERRRVPEYLHITLNEFDLAFGRSDRNAIVIRARLNVILCTTLAGTKREKLDQYSREKGPDKCVSSSTESNASSYNSLHWSLGINLLQPCTHENTRKMLRGRVDYCLWYGRHKEAETNLVVVTPKRSRNSTEGLYPVLAHLSMIMHARKKPGRTSNALYGIATDSWFWTFIRLDTQGKISTHTLHWREGRQVEIISHLSRIMQRAAALSQPTHRDRP